MPSLANCSQGPYSWDQGLCQHVLGTAHIQKQECLPLPNMTNFASATHARNTEAIYHSFSDFKTHPSASNSYLCHFLNNSWICLL